MLGDTHQFIFNERAMNIQNWIHIAFTFKVLHSVSIRIERRYALSEDKFWIHICILQGDIHFHNTKFEYTYTHIHFFWHLCFDIQNLNAIFLWTNGHKLRAFLLIKNEKQPRGPKRHPKKPKRWKKLVAKKMYKGWPGRSLLESNEDRQVSSSHNSTCACLLDFA